MGILRILPLLLVGLHATFATWTLEHMATQYLPADYINSNEAQHTYNGGAANSVAFDHEHSFAYVGGNKWMQVVDYSRFRRPAIVHKKATAAPISDVAQCGYIVAWVTRGPSITAPGTLHVWDNYRRISKQWNMLCTAQVGANPVSLKFFHDCKTIVIANKGTAAEGPAGTFVNPEGTISVVRLTPSQQRQTGRQRPQTPGTGQNMNPTVQANCGAQAAVQMSVTTLDFTRFNNVDPNRYFPGIRMPYDGSLDQSRPTFSQSMEPTFITNDPYFNNTAYVSLRENNAVVQLDITPGNERITGFNPMGFKEWFQNNLDAATGPNPGISFRRYDIFSMRQPNAIAPFEFRSYFGLETFLFTADEGAKTEYRMQGREPWSDAILAKNIAVPPPSLKVDVTDPQRLANLEVSRVEGTMNPSNPSAEYSYLSFFGGRGISMFRFNESNSNLDLVWDSGDKIARGVSVLYPEVFNSKSTTPDTQSHGLVSQKDQASTSLGAQCKSLAIGKVDNGTTLVLTGVDGSSVIGIFSISGNSYFPKYESVYRQPVANREFSILMNQKKLGDIDPSTLIWIPSSRTPDKFNYVMVLGKKSGTLSIYRILNQPHQVMMNRLRKEAMRGGAAATTRSLPAILASLILAAVMRHL